MEKQLIIIKTTKNVCRVGYKYAQILIMYTYPV